MMGASRNPLILTYVQQVRSVLEMAVPVWQPGLTVSEKIDIERVEKSICYILLEKQYNEYGEALAALGLETLDNMRLMLCRSFASKTLEDKQFKSWFTWNERKSKTRRKETKFKKIHTRTKRFERSSIPYLHEMLNKKWERKEDMPIEWKF